MSPFQRAASEVPTGEQPPGPTHGKKKRKARQRKRELYQKVREDLQLDGNLPTAPEGALRPETVPPSAQGSQPMSELVAEAIRRGWAVQDGMKPQLVDEMVLIVLDAEMPAKAKIAAFNALRMADQAQYEQDHPKDKADTGPATVNINVVTVDGGPQRPLEETPTTPQLIEVEVVESTASEHGVIGSS